MTERTERRTIVPGLILILIGVLILLQSLGYPWARADQLWPILVMIAGLASLVNGLIRTPRAPDSVWFGIVALFSGGLFLYITMGAGEWADMAWLWPAFPLIGGAAWLVAWALDTRQVSNLTMGLIGLVVGVVGFLFTYGLLSADQGRQLGQFWPIILVLIGVGLIIQYLVKRD